MKSFIKPIILASTLLATAISASAHPTASCERIMTRRTADVGIMMCPLRMEDAISALGFDGPAYPEYTMFSDGVSIHTLICDNDGMLVHYREIVLCSN